MKKNWRLRQSCDKIASQSHEINQNNKYSYMIKLNKVYVTQKEVLPVILKKVITPTTVDLTIYNSCQSYSAHKEV